MKRKVQPYKRRQIPKDTLTVGMLEAQVARQQAEVTQLTTERDADKRNIAALDHEQRRLRQRLRVEQKKVSVLWIILSCITLVALVRVIYIMLM